MRLCKRAETPNNVRRGQTFGRGEHTVGLLLGFFRLPALLEGGPALNAEFFARGLVDEYFLTLGPVVVGGRDTLTPVEGAAVLSAARPRLDLVSAVANPATGEVYLHYRVLRDSAFAV